MKKKSPIHPRLYISSQLKKDEIILSFISNKFNSNGARMLENEIVSTNNVTIDKTFIKN